MARWCHLFDNGLPRNTEGMSLFIHIIMCIISYVKGHMDNLVNKIKCVCTICLKVLSCYTGMPDQKNL